MNLVMRAASFAAVAHRDQRRKDAAKTPYINHPLNVAKILTNVGIINNSVLAAALHDTIEDCGTIYAEIFAEFGQTVVDLVRECTDNKSLPVVERKKLQIEHAKELSYGAELIKLADKLYNCLDLMNNAPLTWTVSRIQGYFVWTLQVIETMRLQTEEALTLYKGFDVIIHGDFKLGDLCFPCVPSNREQCLANYYVELSSKQIKEFYTNETDILKRMAEANELCQFIKNKEILFFSKCSDIIKCKFWLIV